MQPLEPIPPTVEALDRLERLGDEQVRSQLDRIAHDLERIAPTCVGLSLSLTSAGVTLTMAASNLVRATLDAARYLDGGPCIRSVATGVKLPVRYDVLDEVRWSLFARASALPGVRSSLSLPLLDGTDVVGGVNLYGAASESTSTVRRRTRSPVTWKR